MTFVSKLSQFIFAVIFNVVLTKQGRVGEVQEANQAEWALCFEGGVPVGPVRVILTDELGYKMLWPATNIPKLVTVRTLEVIGDDKKLPNLAIAVVFSFLQFTEDTSEVIENFASIGLFSRLVVEDMEIKACLNVNIKLPRL